jgi:hypothetical protein
MGMALGCEQYRNLLPNSLPGKANDVEPDDLPGAVMGLISPERGSPYSDTDNSWN